VVKQLIDPRTQKKIQVFSGGKKQLEALESMLDVEDIPEFFGGKFKGGWGGDAVTPSARFALDPADRTKVRSSCAVRCNLRFAPT
jgi:hypothetical protein